MSGPGKQLRHPLAWIVISLLASRASLLPAQAGIEDVQPADGALSCTVIRQDVQLSWNIVFFAPIRGFLVVRDGQSITSLPASATGFLDRGVAPGEHGYALFALDLAVALDGADANQPGIDGLAPLGECKVVVPPVDSGIRCKADENRVHLEWGPILPAIAFEGFRVERNGVTIARLPNDQLSYEDEVFSVGTQRYAVFMILGPGDAEPDQNVVDANSNELLLGRCEVAVDCFGLSTRVDGLDVYLDWSGLSLPEIGSRFFTVTRDGELVGKTEETAFTDTVPAPGRYVYQVVMDFSDLEAPARIIAACRVRVPDPGLPAPRNLRCAVAIPQEGESALDPNGVVGASGDAFVSLAWENPTAYDQVAVTRDGALLTTLEGDATQYSDRPPGGGVFEYGVYGIVENRRSEAASCKVEVPPLILPAPANLRCLVADPDPSPVPIDDLAPIDANDPAAIDTDSDGVVDSILPYPLVALSWENPVRYDRIVVTRNKAIIATLEGNATSFTDRPQAGGKIIYGVYGSLGLRRSDLTTCEVDLPPVIVPPPRDFSCEQLGLILDPRDPDNPLGDSLDGTAGADVNVAPVDVVLLKWWNPVKYSALVVSRDNRLIAELPGSATSHRDINPGLGRHVYGIYGVAENGQRSRTAICELVVGPEPVPPVEDLRCLRAADSAGATDGSVVLVWKNGGSYEQILLLRNAELLEELEGETEQWRDVPPGPGVYEYTLIAVRDGSRSPAVSCQVVIPGPTGRNLLYFSGSDLPRVEIDPNGNLADPDGLPDPIGSPRVTCLAANASDLQGWSFGVASDPKFVVPQSADLEDTATASLHDGAGPDFLFLDTLEDESGVIMAVVISTMEPFATLPVGGRHAILNIDYAAGPSGQPGSTHELRYTSALGEPPVEVLYVVDGFELRPATAPGSVTLMGTRFLRGDVTSDGEVDQSDAILILQYLFLGGFRPGCLEAANANGSTRVNIADAIFILTWKFIGGVTIPPPHPDCGFAPAPLGCEDPGFCAP